MVITNGNGGKTTRQKLHEPILNPIQVTILLVIVVFEVVTNILPYLMGWGTNPIWIMMTITIGIVAFAVLSLLRAAYPEAVPDTRIISAFQAFIKQIIDAMFENREERSDLQSLLERIMVWAMREWDVIYQAELADAIKYAKRKFKERELEELEKLE